MAGRKRGRPPKKPKVVTNRWGTFVTFGDGTTLHRKNRAAYDKVAKARRKRASAQLASKRTTKAVTYAWEGAACDALQADGLTVYAAARLVHLNAREEYETLRRGGLAPKAAAKGAVADALSNNPADATGMDAAVKRLQRRAARLAAAGNSDKA